MRTLPGFLALSALTAATAGAQQTQSPQQPQRDPTNTLPLVTTRTATFTTDQGTWVSVDVSPDGSTIVFDLLGDIYTLPIAGGKATRILGGNSIDGQPRYSPDGRSIVFVSDRGGADATWVAGADGRQPRQIASGGHYPAWAPDGAQIITGNRLVGLNGGAGLPLQGFGTAPSFAGDGRYVWYQAGAQAARYDRQTGTSGYRTNLAGGVLRPMVSRDGSSLAYFTRFEAQTALVIRTLATGAERWVTMGTQPPAAVAAPAGGGRGGGRGGRGRGGAPAPGGVGPLPSSAWLPDGSAIVTSFGGKLWRVDVASGRRTQIPFTADVEQSLGPLVKGSYTVSDSVVVREIREPALSPDGRRVAFAALGKIWVMELADENGGPRRLTAASGVVESAPVWTPDGRSVVYATWADGEGGDIFQVDATGGTPRNLTRASALYTRINFTPDGSRLVFARGPRRARTVQVDDAASGARELNLELRWMPAGGGTQVPITMVADAGSMPLGGYPHFTPDTSRVFFHEEDAGLVSVRWDGSDRKVVLAGATQRTLLSPDGVHVITQATRRNQLYLFELPATTDSLTIDPAGNNPPVPIRRLTHAGGDFPAWSRTGSHAVWATGATVHVYDVARGDLATTDSIVASRARAGAAADSAGGAGGRGAGGRGGGAVAAGGGGRGGGAGGAGGGGRGGGAAAQDSVLRWAPAFGATRHDVRIGVGADKPAGVIALRGARVITMNGAEVIANGDVVITGNRITAVGPRGRVTIPPGARTINVSGRTIVPGYLDVHARVAAPEQIHRTVVPQYLANLAFGVTTVRDPESQVTDIFTYADRVATADLIGPRVFTTGSVALDSGLTVRTLQEGRTYLAGHANTWHTNTIRGDYTGTRPDRQRFLQISGELGLTAVAMGTTDFRKSLSAILDGYADHHSAYDVFPIHDDVARLIAESGLTYTPMLLGRVGSRNGIEYIIATENPHADPKVRRFYDHRDLDRLTRARGPWVSADEYPFEDVAAGAARIVAAGGKVAIGTNGRLQGLALHWEMQLLSRGGMPAHDVLRAATIFGAEAIGLGSELGTIEAGKLADLVVLDANPLTDIRNANSIRYVMKNGRLYDGATLDQVAPTAVKLGTLWWMEGGR